MKKLAFFAVFSIFFIFAYINTYAANVRLIIDGQEIQGLVSPPVIRNDSVLVPARAVFERLGGIVGWHSGHRQVTIFHGGDVLVFTIDDNIALLNGMRIPMNVPPMIINDSTMIPLRFPAEAFGFSVYWDPNERVVIVNSSNSVEADVVETPEPPILAPEFIPFPDHLANNNDYHAPGNNEYDGEANDDEEPTQEQPNEEPPVEQTPNNSAPPAWLTEGESPHLFQLNQHSQDIGLARNISAVPIIPSSHPQTTVTHVLTPSDIGSGAYRLVTNSPISIVEYFVLPDNRLVVEIHNAATNVMGILPLHPSVPVTGARITQFSVDPNVARIVFDVVGAAEFTLDLSADRTALTIAFSRNTVTGLAVNTNGINQDAVSIQGEVAPFVHITTEGYPHFLTINIENADILPHTDIFNGVFITHYRAGQRISGSAYIRVYVGDVWPGYSITTSGNITTVAFNMPIIGVRYDTFRRELLIPKSTGVVIDINQIRFVDEHLQRRFTVVLPHSAAELGQGVLNFTDSFVNYITLERDIWGNAQFVFNARRVLEFSIHETDEYYIIRAHLPRVVHPFIVVIDAGHGGDQPGTSHNGVVEKDLVLSISNKVMQLLDEDPLIMAFATRTADVRVLNSHRAEFANDLGADLFISIHANAAELRPGVVNPAVHGIETWYTLGTNYQGMLNSYQFSQIMQRNLIAATGAHNRGLRHSEGLVVTRETHMPAALLEVGFLTNPQEAARLATEEHQWIIAHAIYNGILEALGL